MPDTKIRIDLAQGIIEAEGSEEFVRAVYGDFKGMIGTQAADARPTTDPPAARAKNNATTADSSAAGADRAQREKSRSPAPKIVKDLNLAAANGKPSLRDFFAKYAPANNYQRNLIFVYYLQHERGITGITADHIFTCYRDIVPALRVPGDVMQSLWETASAKGWVNTEKRGDVKVTVPGMNYIEHDMPTAGAKPAKK